MQLTLRVAPGRRVRLPDGSVLPDNEDLVLEVTPFVRRRIASGDLAPPPRTPAPPPAPARASKKD